MSMRDVLLEQKSDEAILPSQSEDTAFLRGTQILLSV